MIADINLIGGGSVSDLFKVKTFTKSISLSANGNAYIDITTDIEMEGYKPVALKGVDNTNGTASIVLSYYTISDTKLYFAFHSLHNATLTPTITIDVLYMKV